MVMKKFNLEAIYPLNLSAKVSSIDDNFDITDDHEKWQKCMPFKPDIPETPLYKSKPMISKDYKKETDVKVGKIFDNKEALDLAIRLKALEEGYQFLNDRSAPERHAAIALAVQDEFPLSYHACTLVYGEWSGEKHGGPRQQQVVEHCGGLGHCGGLEHCGGGDPFCKM
nr:hypothetical protein [Tanacetum cinerariifolium]